MNKRLAIVLAIVCVLGVFVLFRPLSFSTYTFFSDSAKVVNPFKFRAIDTMKYSRDLAEEKLYSKSFDAVIDAQMKLIEDSGATHVAIDTPYDEKFYPILKRWVDSARAHHLAVWFRGNFSGWEGWFGYGKISRASHEYMLNNFLSAHPELFQSGDIFSPCPECENGGPGDPRATGDAAGYNQFLTEEYVISKQAFNTMHKSVTVYASMNADIAKGVIDKDTARALGGTILIDHYVQSPKQFISDVQSISKRLDAKIGIGEFGAPILDLNGEMSQQAQADYIDSILDLLYQNSSIVPLVNYWVLTGGSTALATDNGNAKPVYSIVKSYFTMPKISGKITDTLGEYMQGVTVSVSGTTYSTESEGDGSYAIFLSHRYKKITFEKKGYKTVEITIPDDLEHVNYKDVVLEPTNPSLWYKTKAWMHMLKNKIMAAI